MTVRIIEKSGTRVVCLDASVLTLKAVANIHKRYGKDFEILSYN